MKKIIIPIFMLLPLMTAQAQTVLTEEQQLEQAQKQFGFLLDAFKYGVPPHAGLAYGLDRLIMLMAGEDSIREVMAFPKVKDASCLMMQAPDEVDPKQLEELGLEIEKKEEKEEK